MELWQGLFSIALFGTGLIGVFAYIGLKHGGW
jgi:hypothetical protein